MRKLLIRTSIFCLVLVGTYFFFVHTLSEGYVDMYYPKFKQQSRSLILGLSKAHNGISPSVLEERLPADKVALPILNFAFNQFQSPFGDVYLEGILKKIKTGTTNGIFIISVSPAAFNAPINMTDEAIMEMDGKMILGKIDEFNADPNYNYIINCYAKPLYSVFVKERFFANEVAHANGWNEIRLQHNGNTITEKDMSSWKELNLRGINRSKKKQEISSYRINSFIKTITKLKESGQVYLLRFPSESEVVNFENDYWPNFDTQMDSISIRYNVPYFNYTTHKTDYTYYDGVHMASKSAIAFTEELSRDINDHMTQTK